MIPSLVDAIRARQAILFVGAGVSKNLGLPSWDQLIAEMGTQLGFDPLVFKSHGNMLELAEFYELKKTSLGALRSWMDRTWHENEERVDTSEIHRAIIQLQFPIIYTTNYDRWLEIAFRRQGHEIAKIANVGDFARIQDGLPQIVKLHGDFEDDTSLVLTETSYFERLAFESPLDIKLRSDIIGRPILFIGYGFADLNIRYLQYKLDRLWKSSAHARSRPKSYMFLPRPNPVQEAILDRRGILPIVSDNDDPGAGLAAFLTQLVKEAFGATS